MNYETPSSRTDSTKSSTHRNPQTPDTSHTETNASPKRVGVYDRPTTPTTRTSSMIGVVLLLIALALVVYFFFLAA